MRLFSVMFLPVLLMYAAAGVGAVSVMERSVGRRKIRSRTHLRRQMRGKPAGKGPPPGLANEDKTTTEGPPELAGGEEPAEEMWCHFFNITAAQEAGHNPTATKMFHTITLEEGETFPSEDFYHTVAGSCEELCHGRAGLLHHMCPALPGFRDPYCTFAENSSGECFYNELAHPTESADAATPEAPAKGGGNGNSGGRGGNPDEGSTIEDSSSATITPAPGPEGAIPATATPETPAEWCYFHVNEGKFKTVSMTESQVEEAEAMASAEGNPESRSYMRGTCQEACKLTFDFICPDHADYEYDCRRCQYSDVWTTCVYELYGDSKDCVDPAGAVDGPESHLPPSP